MLEVMGFSCHNDLYCQSQALRAVRCAVFACGSVGEKMATKVVEKAPENLEDDLVDYEADEPEAEAVKAGDANADVKKGSYAGIHSSGFKDFLLKAELLRAISDCGFEHPSEGTISVLAHQVDAGLSAT